MIQLLLRVWALGILLALSPLLQAQLSAEVNPQKAGFSTKRLQRFATYLNQEVDQQKVPGAVCLIYRKGTLAHYDSYGKAFLEKGTPMQKDQIFYIQSMTKPIISVAFMMLYEEGYFELNDRLDTYFPEFKDMQVAEYDSEGSGDKKAMNLVEPETPITLAHLLSHTAGFSHGLGNSELDLKYRQALYFKAHQSIKERALAMAELPLIGHPGEQWYYSASPDLLALLVEHFTGMNPAEFIQQRIFDPLGMKDTGYNLNDEQKTRVVGLHVFDDDGKLMESPMQTSTSGTKVFGGTHGLFSTAADYLKFCQMLLNGGTYDGKQLLSRKTVELMAADHLQGVKRTPGHGFGLGFGVRTDVAASNELGSEGIYYWNGAYNTHFFIDPKEELIAILMTQTAPYTGFYSRKLRQFVYQAIND